MESSLHCVAEFHGELAQRFQSPVMQLFVSPALYRNRRRSAFGKAIGEVIVEVQEALAPSLDELAQTNIHERSEQQLQRAAIGSLEADLLMLPTSLDS
jgi:hypothetical protein